MAAEVSEPAHESKTCVNCKHPTCMQRTTSSNAYKVCNSRMDEKPPAPEHGITATGMYVVTEKMLQKIELESGVLLDSLRSRPAQQPQTDLYCKYLRYFEDEYSCELGLKTSSEKCQGEHLSDIIHECDSRLLISAQQPQPQNCESKYPCPYAIVCSDCKAITQWAQPPEPKCRHWYSEKRDGVALYECHAKQQPDALAELEKWHRDKIEKLHKPVNGAVSIVAIRSAKIQHEKSITEIARLRGGKA